MSDCQMPVDLCTEKLHEMSLKPSPKQLRFVKTVTFHEEQKEDQSPTSPSLERDPALHKALRSACTAVATKATWRYPQDLNEAYESGNIKAYDAALDEQLELARHQAMVLAKRHLNLAEKGLANSRHFKNYTIQ